jgi:nucleotide-binding universal stress UspA family protein
MFKKILLAVDGSGHSNKVIETGVEMAVKFGAEIVILNTYFIPERFNAHESSHYTYLRKIEESMVKHGTDLLSSLKSELEAKGIKVKTFLEKGPASTKIITKAASEECDLIIVGTRGLGNVTSLIIGSTSNYVLHHASCPVLLTK